MASPPFYSSFAPPFSSTIPPPSPNLYGYPYSSYYNHEHQLPLPCSQPQPPPLYTPSPHFHHSYSSPLPNPYTPYSTPPPSAPYSYLDVGSSNVSDQQATHIDSHHVAPEISFSTTQTLMASQTNSIASVQESISDIKELLQNLLVAVRAEKELSDSVATEVLTIADEMGNMASPPIQQQEPDSRFLLAGEEEKETDLISSPEKLMIIKTVMVEKNLIALKPLLLKSMFTSPTQRPSPPLPSTIPVLLPAPEHLNHVFDPGGNQILNEEERLGLGISLSTSGFCKKRNEANLKKHSLAIATQLLYASITSRCSVGLSDWGFVMTWISLLRRKWVDREELFLMWRSKQFRLLAGPCKSIVFFCDNLDRVLSLLFSFDYADVNSVEIILFLSKATTRGSTHNPFTLMIVALQVFDQMPKCFVAILDSITFEYTDIRHIVAIGALKVKPKGGITLANYNEMTWCFWTLLSYVIATNVYKLNPLYGPLNSTYMMFVEMSEQGFFCWAALFEGVVARVICLNRMQVQNNANRFGFFFDVFVGFTLSNLYANHSWVHLDVFFGLLVQNEVLWNMLRAQQGSNASKLFFWLQLISNASYDKQILIFALYLLDDEQSTWVGLSLRKMLYPLVGIGTGKADLKEYIKPESGDFCLKEYGVISIPAFSHPLHTDKYQFIVLASGGVWDVLSNEETVKNRMNLFHNNMLWQALHAHLPTAECYIHSNIFHLFGDQCFNIFHPFQHYSMGLSPTVDSFMAPLNFYIEDCSASLALVQDHKRMVEFQAWNHTNPWLQGESEISKEANAFNCKFSIFKPAEFKQWDPGKNFKSDFYNLEDKVGLEGQWNVRNNTKGYFRLNDVSPTQNDGKPNYPLVILVIFYL